MEENKILRKILAKALKYKITDLYLFVAKEMYYKKSEDAIIELAKKEGKIINGQEQLVKDEIKKCKNFFK